MTDKEFYVNRMTNLEIEHSDMTRFEKELLKALNELIKTQRMDQHVIIKESK